MSKKKYFLLFLAVFLSFRGGSFMGRLLLDAYYSYGAVDGEGIDSKILVNGDVEAYRRLQKTLSQRPEQLLFYSMVMAKQHGYEPAGEDVCNIINEWYDSHPAMGPKGKRAQFLLEEFGHQKASQQD